MSTGAWGAAGSLFGFLFASATPQGGGCGGPGSDCSDHCGGGGGETSSGGASGGAGPIGAGLTILATTSGGDGCPGASSVDASYDHGARTVTLTYPPVSVAKSGPGFDHASCATGLTVKGVPGWQFGATGSSLHGSAELPDGATVRIKTSVYFAGAPATGEREVEIDGPKQGAFDDTGTFPGGGAVYSPCGQDAIFNVQVGTSVQSSAQASASVDVQSVALPLAWRACH